MVATNRPAGSDPGVTAGLEAIGPPRGAAEAIPSAIPLGHAAHMDGEHEASVILKGITWNHPRGYAPLVATAADYSAGHPEVRIHWEQRTLQEFADYPLSRLATMYDLMVIDHPHLGSAIADGCLLPLDGHLSAAQLGDQAAHSVGKSNESYILDGRQWALATDVAAHVSAYRRDLLERYGEVPPRCWEEVLALARRLYQSGRAWIAVPLIPVDTLMCFYSLCANAGEEPFSDEGRVVSRPVGQYAVEMLQALHAHNHPEALAWNPPRALDHMSTADDVVYCPLLFGYANYARPGFRPSLVHFTTIPSAGHGPRGAILGGAGMAVSSRSAHPEAACAYAAYVAQGDIQSGRYFDAGGQPGHRAAWTDARVNEAASGFFLDTLETLDTAYLRPRYNGYMEVQDQGGDLLHTCLRQGGDPNTVLNALDAMYQDSRRDRA